LGKKIAIIDYGVGNLRSVFKGLEYCGVEPVVTDDPAVVEESDGIVLPGVGAFADAMMRLKPFERVLKECAGKKPMLGICLGMQLYFTLSEEDGINRGLDLMKGRVLRLPDSVKIPQMGWNSIEMTEKSELLEGIKDGDFFYFVHSYYAKPEEDVTLAFTRYGVDVPAVVGKGNLFATQFHPEKSGKAGLRILENFVGIVDEI